MDSRLIKSINALNGAQFGSIAGRHHGLTLYWTGTNATATPGDFPDLGSIIITLNRPNQGQIDNVEMGPLSEIIDIRFGSNLLDSTGSAAFIASTYVPFFESGEDDKPFNNAINLREGDEINIEWVPDGNIAAVFSDLTLNVYAELAAYPEKYIFKILRDDVSESTASAGKPYPMNKHNITGLFLNDPGDIVDLVQLEQNNRTLISPQPWDILLANTLRKNKLETTTYAMIELQTFSKGNPASAVNRNTILTLTTSGGGDVPLVTTSIDWKGSRGGQ